MAKLSKSQLKAIVKECLVEILEEGINSKSVKGSPLRESNQPKKSRQRNPALDQIKFNSTVKETVDNLTDDPIMASIFADTAKTTLQDQYNSHSRGTGTISESLESPNAGPNNLDEFGDAASNWATLAFADKKLPGS